MSKRLLQRRADRSGPKDYEYLLQVDDVHLSFKGVKAIDGVSFHVDDGELFAIIGPNGAGPQVFGDSHFGKDPTAFHHLADTQTNDPRCVVDQ